jgi:alkanesulfonate monooxygenase SsuD/methylene tetrahydromethanopterin reductase-like flavin-dependent oxidoreductase (luciferase family)
MKFMLFMLPAVPATPEERRRLRPVAANTERFQQMLREVTELSQVADDLGFDMISFPEHFLQTEGLEMGGTPSLHAHIAARTRNIKVGPMGFVLPGWNPLRLACEVGWLDQITQGRTFIGLARGYQTRWLNAMAQQLNISATMSDQSDIDRANREAFDEVLKILKLAWGDEPFAFKGKYYEYPYPYETGTPWRPRRWTEEYGAPGEIEDGMIKKIMVVPKPYQKPHPPPVPGLLSQRIDHHFVRPQRYRTDDSGALAPEHEAARGGLPQRGGQGRLQLPTRRKNGGFEIRLYRPRQTGSLSTREVRLAGCILL